MKDLTIRLRLMILGILVVSGIIISGGFGIYQLSKFNAHLESDLTEVRTGIRTLIQIQQAGIDFKTQIQEWKNILLRGNDQAEFDKYKKAFQEKEKAVQEKMKQALETLKKENHPVVPDLEKLLETHLALGKTFMSELGSFDVADSGAGEKVDKAVRGKDRATTESMNKVVAALEKSEVDHLEEQVKSSQATFAASRNVLIGLMVIGFIISLAIVGMAVRQINNQIEKVRTTVNDVKAQLDLTRRIPLSGQDEMGQIAVGVNALLDEFQSVVGRMKQGANHVSYASDGLAHSVNQLSNAVGQQNEATSAMAASVEELAVSVTHVSDSAGTSESIATDSLRQSKQGAEVIERTVNEMVGMAGTVQTTSTTMEGLGKRTDEIGSIAGVIKDIADQTNLLALNAAIEAARAGEQGRGFAVVADEVRKLAERTATATTEIASVIGAIQSETRRAVDDMHHIVERVGSAAKVAREAGEAIVHIQEGSQRVVEVSSDISTALKEQSSASELIAKQVEVIAAMSEENTNAMNEARESSNEMKSLSAEMHAVVDRFKV